MRKTLTLLLCCFVILVPSCRNEAERALNSLKAKGVKLAPGEFLSRVKDNDLGTVHEFLVAGILPAGRNKTKDSALRLAASKGYRDMTALLLENGADIAGQSEDGWTALRLASRYGHPEIVRLLIAAGADIEASNSEGATALMVAAAQGRDDVVRVLLSRGGNRDATTKLGATALMYASANGHAQVAKTLGKAGADVNQTDAFGYTALADAASEGQSEVIRVLVALGANPNESYAGATTPLMWAVHSGKSSAVATLIDLGAEVDSPARSCAKVLAESSEIAAKFPTLLLRQSLDRYCTSEGGIAYTPLMIAVLSGDDEAVHILVDAKARVNRHFEDGWTLLDRAILLDGTTESWIPNSSRRYKNIIRLLRRAGARIEKSYNLAEKP